MSGKGQVAGAYDRVHAYNTCRQIGKLRSLKAPPACCLLLPPVVELQSLLQFAPPSGGAPEPAIVAMPPLHVRSWNVGLQTSEVGARLRRNNGEISNLDIVMQDADIVLLQEVGTWFDPPPKDTLV